MVSADYGLGRHKKAAEHGRVCMCCALARDPAAEDGHASAEEANLPHPLVIMTALPWQERVHVDHNCHNLRVMGPCISIERGLKAVCAYA